MPVITRWSRSAACSGRAPTGSSSAARSSGGSGQASGPSVATASSAASALGREDLDPRGLLACRTRAGAARAPSSMRTSSRDVRSRSAGALVEQLQAPGAHEVHEHVQVAADVDDEVLADAPHALDRAAVERVQRRVERLERVDARRQRRLDRRARAAPRSAGAR